MIAYLLVLPAVLSAQTRQRHVPLQYRTIQAAVDAARVGDTVLVDHGRYVENLRIAKNLVLASRFVLDGDTSHISRTIIDGSRPLHPDRGSVVSVVGETDTNCIIIGLTIRGGSGNVRIDPNSPSAPWRYGGGIDVASFGARVEHNFITDNRLRGGRGIDTLNGGGVFFGSTMMSRGHRYFILHGNRIVSNHLEAVCCQGAGVYAYYSGRITDNIITDNSNSTPKYNNGGGICLSADAWSAVSPLIIVSGNQIRRNRSPHAGGIFIYGFRSVYPTVFLTNNIIADNDAFDFEGGGIDSHRGPFVVMSHNTIVGNRAKDFGGGMHVSSSDVVLFNNIIWSNTPATRLQSPTLLYAARNIVDGPVIGEHNIQADPQFAAGDTMFRLRAGSPAVGFGTLSVFAFGHPYGAPANDAEHRSRIRADMSLPDLGAIEAEVTAGRSFGADKPRVTILMALDERTAATTGDQPRVRLSYSGQDRTVRPFGDEVPTVDVPADAEAVIVDFVKPRDRSARNLLYFYYLEGGSAASVVYGFSTTDAFRDLSPGIHRLTVGTFFAVPGRMTEEIQYHAVNFRVASPWYTTPVATAAFVLSGLLVLFALFRREVVRLQREHRLQTEFSALQVRSQDLERERLAGELHDGLGQNLLLASNELQLSITDRDGDADDLVRVDAYLKESIRSVREMASNLHPHQLERLGFSAAVKGMAQGLEHASGLRIDFRGDGIDGLLPKDAEAQLYRIVQEALTNVVRHSGASRATVEIWKGPRRVEVSVTDDGKGFRPGAQPAGDGTDGGGAHGYGLSSMTQRARLIGGDVTISSSPGGGTRVWAVVPLPRRRT